MTTFTMSPQVTISEMGINSMYPNTISYTGTAPFDAGMVYAPYMPVITLPTNPEHGQVYIDTSNNIPGQVMIWNENDLQWESLTYAGLDQPQVCRITLKLDDSLFEID